jgi:hypothetical protein
MAVDYDALFGMLVTKVMVFEVLGLSGLRQGGSSGLFDLTFWWQEPSIDRMGRASRSKDFIFMG